MLTLRTWAVGLALLLAGAVPALAQDLTVVLVRHAEKVDDSRDPALSEAGHRRAEALADILADAGVSAIYTTQFQRTVQTAAPLAQRLGVAAQVVPASGGTHAADVAARVREHREGTVVVVGHSNTVPDIIATLGGPVLTIGDDEYDHLFILRLTADGVRIIRARY
ncbi:MAG TPA: phosphoglycerate mutase family protein [Longimicrobiales bacterium]|nr:phosphoglycerate mutase family protein [Longimicrobiales bacterium]